MPRWIAFATASLFPRLRHSTLLHVEVIHGGLKGRELRSAGNRLMHQSRTTQEEAVSSMVDCTLADLQTNLVELVRSLVAPLFMVFEFFEVPDTVLAELVNNFVEGRVT